MTYNSLNYNISCPMDIKRFKVLEIFTTIVYTCKVIDEISDINLDIIIRAVSFLCYVTCKFDKNKGNKFVLEIEYNVPLLSLS